MALLRVILFIAVLIISVRGYQRMFDLPSSRFDPHLIDPLNPSRLDPISLSRPQPGNGSWFESENKKYYLEYRYLKFHDVKDYCRDLNMSMIQIRNWRENIFVRDLDNRNLIPIGIEFHDGRWKWADGSELGYTNWDEWEPRCGAFCTTIYMKLSGRWYFDQGGYGIVACESIIEKNDQMTIKSDRDFQRQLLSTMKDVKATLDFMKLEVKKRIRGPGDQIEHTNTIPQRIMVSLNKTRINP